MQNSFAGIIRMGIAAFFVMIAVAACIYRDEEPSGEELATFVTSPDSPTATTTPTSVVMVALATETVRPTISPAPTTPANPNSTPTKTAQPDVVLVPTPVSVPVATPIISPTLHTAEPILSTPTAASVALVSPTPTMNATGIVTPTAASSPSPTALPTPTAVPSPIPTAIGPTPTAFFIIPTPDATPKPTPTPDARYGLIVGGRDNPEAPYFANAMSVSWYLDYGAGGSVSPELNKLRAIMLESGFHPYSDSEITAMVSAAPGSYFQIGNEPNIFGNAVHQPSGYADALSYYATRIKAADPTAKIVGPNILNFDFTCVGCGGYTAGHVWLDQMRQAYVSKYGTEPPIDIWAIHQYPLDWLNFPTVNDKILTQDLEAFRTYLDSIPAHSGSEIWITEFGLHWGFEGLQYQKDGTTEPCDPGTVERCWPGPVGEYQTNQVIGFLDRLTSYYKNNSDRLKLTKWFLWRHHHIFGPNPTGTNGLTLFDSFFAGGQLTTVGNAYRDLVHGN